MRSSGEPPTWVLIQFGLGGLPLGPGSLGSFLSPHQLLLEALVEVPQLAGSHHSGIALETLRQDEQLGGTVPKCVLETSQLCSYSLKPHVLPQAC